MRSNWDKAETEERYPQFGDQPKWVFALIDRLNLRHKTIYKRFRPLPDGYLIAIAMPFEPGPVMQAIDKATHEGINGPDQVG
jgi:hypothetical protein